MSRIVYGVSGEGSGHTSRAREMVRHLLDKGHDVRVVAYDRSYASLKDEFDCLEIEGLHIVSRDNRVSALGTLAHNLHRARKAIARNRALRQLFDQFQPELVITDFEPATAWLARWRNIPLLSLDNQHRLRDMKFRVPASLLLDKWLTRLIIALMIPRPDIALATSLEQGPSTHPRTRIFPPIVRQQVLDLQPANEDFHVVYVTSAFDSLIYALRFFEDRTFHVYGHHAERVDGNIHYRAFSGDAFVQDLARCRSVIATAGFTLMSERPSLPKPLLALPMTGQFEQQVNALFLERSGCGMNARRASVEVLQTFFARDDQCRAALQDYNAALTARGCEPYGGKAIQETLDSLLAELPRRAPPALSFPNPSTGVADERRDTPR